MTLRCTIRCLLMFALGLPLVQATLLWVARLLGAMGDQAAARVVGGVNTGVGVVWLLTLVGLVVTLAVRAVQEPAVSEGCGPGGAESCSQGREPLDAL